MNRTYRFIPAGAGNTESGMVMVNEQAVYPRWRGEHRIDSPRLRTAAGLSPLARGTPLPVPPCCFRSRFIPAGAGNTVVDAHKASLFQVYPRWRGEHRFTALIASIPSGLSPLARGTRLLPLLHQGVLRFIPAGAGNTFLLFR